MAMLSQELRRLHRVPEVARILDTTDQRVYEMLRQGILPGVRMGRQVRIDRVALEKFIENGGQSYPGGWKKKA